MMTVGHILDEIKRIKKCREKIQAYKNNIEKDVSKACQLFNDNITDIDNTFIDTVDILGNLELLFRNKIEKIEVDI